MANKTIGCLIEELEVIRAMRGDNCPVVFRIFRDDSVRRWPVVEKITGVAFAPSPAPQMGLPGPCCVVEG